MARWVRALNAYAKSKPKPPKEEKAKEEKPAKEKKEKAKKEKAPKGAAAAEDTWTLKDAEKTLSSLKGADFKELKAMESPPPAVNMTMGALCVLLDVSG